MDNSADPDDIFLFKSMVLFAEMISWCSEIKSLKQWLPTINLLLVWSPSITPIRVFP